MDGLEVGVLKNYIRNGKTVEWTPLDSLRFSLSGIKEFSPLE